jgi:TolB-like protein/AraC-like DNA-binding protein
LINQKSIAVLPLENLSSDLENEYFSDGMTEEIIAALSKVKGLKVAARTSSFAFKEIKKDVRHIGNELGVSLVLEGSVRKFGDQVRITTQLIRTDNGFQIWSENFNRKLDDIFALQDEISLLVAERIRENYGHLELKEHLVTPSTESIDAYDTFLKAKFFLKRWNLKDIQKGALLFEQSAKLDPAFEMSLFGAGLCYSLLGSWGAMEKEYAFKRAESYFQKGGEGQQPKSVYAYHSLATHEFWGLWDYHAANKLILEALKMDPYEPDVHECLAELLTALGDFDAALSSINTSIQHNPLSPNHFYTRANIYYQQKQYDLAQSDLNKSLEIDPDFALSIQLKLACCIQQHNLEALKKLIDSRTDLKHPAQYLMLFHLTHGDEVVKESAVRAMIEKLGEVQPRPLMAYDLYLMAQISSTEALDMLKMKLSKQMGQVVYFKHESFLTPLRTDQEYQKLVSQYFPDDQLEHPEILQNATSKSLMAAAEVNHYTDILEDLMQNEHQYLDTSLTLRTLADTINLHPNKLSWLLNERLEKNFNDYVNSYRLKDFQRKAIDPQYSHLTLLGLAYESGFTSKSVFNEFFRKNTGVTPKAWLKKQKAN